MGLLLSRRGVVLAGAAFVGAPLAAVTRGASATPSLHRDLEGLKPFVGAWNGRGEGQPGISTVERSYEVALGGRFIAVRNRSIYAPQDKNPTGEVHDDAGYLSFDKFRGRYVLRQFHVEGFVNQFVAATPGFEAGTLVFDSEAIENIPAGWRARETYRFAGNDAFEETFELAEPGRGFMLYAHNRFTRASG